MATGITAVYIDADTFEIQGEDKTDLFLTDRRVKADCGTDGNKYTEVVSATFDGTDTTVDVDDSVLTSNLAEVFAGVVGSGSISALPLHTHGDDDQGGVFAHTNLNAGDGSDHTYIDQSVTSTSSPTFTGLTLGGGTITNPGEISLNSDFQFTFTAASGTTLDIYDDTIRQFRFTQDGNFYVEDGLLSVEEILDVGTHVSNDFGELRFTDVNGVRAFYIGSGDGSSTIDFTLDNASTIHVSGGDIDHDGNLVMSDGSYIGLGSASERMVFNDTDGRLDFESMDINTDTIYADFVDLTNWVKFYETDSGELVVEARDGGNSSGLERLRVDTAGNLGVGTDPVTSIDTVGAFTSHDLSSDPSNPSNGSFVIWQSDGTGTGSDGDVLIKIADSGGTVTTYNANTKFDYLNQAVTTSSSPTFSDATISGTTFSTHIASSSAHHTKYTDSDAQTAVVDNTAYGSGWDGDTNHSPSRNSVYDKFQDVDPSPSYVDFDTGWMRMPEAEWIRTVDSGTQYDGIRYTSEPDIIQTRVRISTSFPGTVITLSEDAVDQVYDPGYINIDTSNNLIQSPGIQNAVLSQDQDGNRFTINRGDIRFVAISKTPDFNSGWTSASTGNTYTESHGLGTEPTLVRCEFRNTTDGYRMPTMSGNTLDQAGNVKQCCVIEIDSSDIVLRAHNNMCGIDDENGNYYSSTSGEYRILAWDWTPDYDSGWQSISTGDFLNFRHDLGHTPSLVQLLVSNTNDWSGYTLIAHDNRIRNQDRGSMFQQIGPEYICVMAGTTDITEFIDDSGNYASYSSGYVRVHAWY